MYVCVCVWGKYNISPSLSQYFPNPTASHMTKEQPIPHTHEGGLLQFIPQTRGRERACWWLSFPSGGCTEGGKGPCTSFSRTACSANSGKCFRSSTGREDEKASSAGDMCFEKARRQIKMKSIGCRSLLKDQCQRNHNLRPRLSRTPQSPTNLAAACMPFAYAPPASPSKPQESWYCSRSSASLRWCRQCSALHATTHQG